MHPTPQGWMKRFTNFYQQFQSLTDETTKKDLLIAMGDFHAIAREETQLDCDVSGTFGLGR